MCDSDSVEHYAWLGFPNVVLVSKACTRPSRLNPYCLRAGACLNPLCPDCGTPIFEGLQPRFKDPVPDAKSAGGAGKEGGGAGASAAAADGNRPTAAPDNSLSHGINGGLAGVVGRANGAVNSSAHFMVAGGIRMEGDEESKSKEKKFRKIKNERKQYSQGGCVHGCIISGCGDVGI